MRGREREKFGNVKIVFSNATNFLLNAFSTGCDGQPTSQSSAAESMAAVSPFKMSHVRCSRNIGEIFYVNYSFGILLGDTHT